MLSTFPTLLPFLLFAFVASITPGPTNILVLSNSARFGFKAAVPIILGACASAAVIVVLSGYGFGEVIDQRPHVQALMQWIGVGWLSYLAWQIYHAPPMRLGESAQKDIQPTSLWTAIAMQWVNPKTWMMALAVVNVFANASADRNSRILVLSLLFFLVAVPCLCVWGGIGASARRRLRSDSSALYVNKLMGILLFISTWLGVGIS